MTDDDKVSVRTHTRAKATGAVRSEPSKLGASATFAMRASKTDADAEAYAHALAPVLRRWCERPLEVARWLVRILESETP